MVGVSAELDLVSAVLAACVSTGSAAAEPIDRAAAVLRTRHAASAERIVQSAQARLSSMVMTVLPVAMLGLLVGISGDTRTAVLTPLGLTVLTLGGMLNLLGWLWSKRIIRIVAQ